MTGKKELRWKVEEQETFRKLKRLLTIVPVLTVPSQIIAISFE